MVTKIPSLVALLYILKRLPWGIRWQFENGSPVNPRRQEQIGEWFRTLHSAFVPQVPGHGSTHLLLTHDLRLSQSEFWTHSGRHPVYGSPKYSCKHVQEPAPFCSRQTAFEPHGDGLHGLLCSTGTKNENENKYGRSYMEFKRRAKILETWTKCCRILKISRFNDL